MTKNKMLLQMELFDEISQNGLSPNQYYLLCCIRDSISPLKINLHLELRTLVSKEFITKEHKLLPKGIALVNKLERSYAAKKMLSGKNLMGSNYEKQIDKFRMIFPAKKLDTGKPARASAKNMEKAFRWFFENYDYEWDIIFKATENYVDECERKNWKYVKGSQYFVRKDNLSELADHCDMVVEGVEDKVFNHKIRIV